MSTYGTPSVEITFEGPPPQLPLLSEEIFHIGNHLRIQTRDPQGVIAQVFKHTGEGTGTIHNIEVIRPNLEGVYLHLTGRRYTASKVSEPSSSIHPEKEKTHDS